MKRLAFCAMAIWALSVSPKALADPALDSAVADYNKRQYSAAVTKLLAIKKTQGKNANVRYYLGACYQALGKYDLAKEEYRWVYKNGPKPLNEYARIALSRLGEALDQAQTQAAKQPQSFLFTSGIHPEGFAPGQGSAVPRSAPAGPNTAR